MSDYIELEYIKSTGTQYIDTDFILKSTSDVEFEFAYLNGSWDNNWIPLAGVRNTQESTDNPCYTFFINSSTLKLSSEYAGYDAGSESSLPIINVNQKYKFSCINKKYFVNDDETHYSYTSNNLQDSKMIYSAYIFCMNKVGIADLRNLSMKLYSFKIWDNDVLVRDFIPVKRKSDNEVCLYDKVSNTFYTNQGTGSFIAGPEISEPTIKDNIYLISNKLVNLTILSSEILYGYKELEYIESTGTQYIDTGILFNSSYRYDFEYALSKTTSADTKFFGVDNSPYAHIGTIGNQIRYEILNDNQIFKSQDTNKHIVSYGTNCIVDNEILISNQTWSFNVNTYIFGCYSGSSVNQFGSIKLYNFKIYNNLNELVRDFIPVKRLSDNIICLYDKVTKQYFTNQGTGTFIGGLPKNPTTEDILNASLYHYQSTTSSNSREINTGIAQSNLRTNTMLFKIKPTAWASYYGLIGKHVDSSGWNIQAFTNSNYPGGGTVNFSYGGGNGNVGYLTFRELAVNNTHIIIMQLDGSTLEGRLYLNNILKSQTFSTSFSSYGNLYLGKSYNASDRYFHGYIYQFYVWDRIFTDDQLTDLYNYFKD